MKLLQILYLEIFFYKKAIVIIILKNVISGSCTGGQLSGYM